MSCDFLRLLEATFCTFTKEVRDDVLEDIEVALNYINGAEDEDDVLDQLVKCRLLIERCYYNHNVNCTGNLYDLSLNVLWVHGVKYFVPDVSLDDFLNMDYTNSMQRHMNALLCQKLRLQLECAADGRVVDDFTASIREVVLKDGIQFDKMIALKNIIMQTGMETVLMSILWMDGVQLSTGWKRRFPCFNTFVKIN
jgi:hypothetical protein